MAIGEFELIKKYFSSFDKGEGIFLGIGDDCALIDIPQDKHLAITTDTQVEGVHFFKGTDPYLIGYKSLLVNTSDLCAMGAKPYCFTLSLSLPTADEDFLSKFSLGLYTLAKKLNMPLIGGNTTKGELAITISAYGLCDKDSAMLRSKAQVLDDIYVTGTLGGPALAVEAGYQKIKLDGSLYEQCQKASMLIESRHEIAYELSKVASCAIDISDGLYGDLGHILESSKVGCNLYVDKLPHSPLFDKVKIEESYLDKLCLFGGGDYELLFTCSSHKRAIIQKIASEYNVPITLIGNITNNDAIKLIKHDKIFTISEKSFEHF